jgi:hypothetical protein
MISHGLFILERAAGVNPGRESGVEDRAGDFVRRREADQAKVSLGQDDIASN